MSSKSELEMVKGLQLMTDVLLNNVKDKAVRNALQNITDKITIEVYKVRNTPPKIAYKK